MVFIKLYHSIWLIALSSNAFRVYCSILGYMNTDTRYANVSMRKLAVSVGISEKSVSRGIRELQEKKLLAVVEKHYNGHRLANGYLITPQSGRHTKTACIGLIRAGMCIRVYGICVSVEVFRREETSVSQP